MGVGNRILSNAEIADRLASLAQLLSAQKENPYKVKAYQRAANSIPNLSDSVHELVQREADLTAYTGIGRAIDSAIREIVLTARLRSSKNFVPNQARNSSPSVTTPVWTRNEYSGSTKSWPSLP